MLCAQDTKRPKRSSAKEPSKGKPPPPSAAEESEDEQSDASAQDTKRVKPSSAVGSSRLSAATPPVSRSASASSLRGATSGIRTSAAPEEPASGMKTVIMSNRALGLGTPSLERDDVYEPTPQSWHGKTCV